ncbi:interleukin-1 receptor-associated kinase 1 [Eucyclogobius newberryi]|uniref:interleukin-1 receptor-associated kinase 1 n=1 Tax=Eucyclogobius newberryi TaxID=166745 RepID=UPI003B5C87BE
MAAARADLRALPLYKVSSPVHVEFCRVMDLLSDQDWTRFASEVLQDQTDMRTALKQKHRTDWLMVQWQQRNGSVGQLLDLLQRLELQWPRDIINNWVSSLPPPAVTPLPSVSAEGFNSPHRVLPKPPPPPNPPESGQSSVETLPQVTPAAAAAAASLGVCTLGVMAWAYEEVHAGTCDFCSSLKVGEGGFGEVFRVNLRNTDCAVKKFKQDCSLDWSLLRESFQTEVEKLSKFRHPNIVDLLGYSDGGGTLCLIYSFMENRSLDDQLHSDGLGLSWRQRISIAKGAATALQYLHCPPVGQMPLVHGDVKSSNILLDHHFEAKLADFGLARFSFRSSSGHSAVQTCSIGKTQTVRGTLAYLPEEYIRGGKLKPVVDVYGFGVVLLEILTGRRALERDKKTGQDIYLKELVNDIEDNEAQWRKQLDKRLVSCGDAEPTGFMLVVSLARRCLDRKRPSMREVYKALHDLRISLNPSSSSSSSLPSVLYPSATSAPRPGHPRSLDFSALSLNTVDPSEHAYCPKASSLSPPQTLHSFTGAPAHPPHGSSSPPSLRSSFDEPCETDESRGYSQYDVRSNGLGPSRPKSDQNHFTQPLVPTENQYNFPPHSKIMGPIVNQAAALPECTSPAGSLQSLSPVVLNPSKQRLLEKMPLYDQGRIQTPELLSSDELYLVSPAESRLPEESDELEYLQSKTQ